VAGEMSEKSSPPLFEHQGEADVLHHGGEKTDELCTPHEVQEENPFDSGGKGFEEVFPGSHRGTEEF